jgi:hypothetical protein
MKLSVLKLKPDLLDEMIKLCGGPAKMCGERPQAQ